VKRQRGNSLRFSMTRRVKRVNQRRSSCPIPGKQNQDAILIQDVAVSGPFILNAIKSNCQVGETLSAMSKFLSKGVNAPFAAARLPPFPSILLATHLGCFKIRRSAPLGLGEEDYACRMLHRVRGGNGRLDDPKSECGADGLWFLGDGLRFRGGGCVLRSRIATTSLALTSVRLCSSAAVINSPIAQS
jgi:hypothetical protein